MKKVITFFARRPVAVIMIVTAILLGGFVSFLMIPLDRLPEIVVPQLMIETRYPGMSARDLRSSVTIPLEDALSSAKGLDGMSSVSRDEVSLITLDFRWGTDPSNAAALVREAVDRVYPGLPHGIEKPSVVSGNIGDEPHAIVAVRSLNGDNQFARNLSEYELKARLRRLDGVGTVILSGGETREIHFKVNPELVAARNFNGDELAGLIAAEIVDVPAGNIREGNRELTVVSRGRPLSMESFSRLILPSAAGPVDLRYLGTATQEIADKKSLFIFQNDEQCSLEIYRRPGADPIKLSDDIKTVLEQANRDFAGDAELTLVCDSSSSILEGIKNLVISAVLAAAAVAVILVVFIRHFRSGLFAAFALPISAAASIVSLKFFGRSLNTMSLCGLAMGIGLVSDASVVVLDVLNRGIKSGGKPCPAIIGDLAASVSDSGFGGTITTCIVFVPIVFLPGPLGALFGDLAVSLVVSVVMGWIYAQFFLPALFHFFYSKSPAAQQKSTERFYSPLLKNVLRRPGSCFAAALVFVLLGIFILVNRPVDFFASDEAAEVEVIAEFPSGIIIGMAGVQAKQISEILSGVKSVSSFYGKMGAEDEDIGKRADPSYRKERMIFRCFLRKDIKRDEALAEVVNSLSQFNSGETEISAGFPKDRTGKLLGFSSPLSLMIKAEKPEDVAAILKSTAFSISSDAGPLLSGINIRPKGTRPELRIIPDRYALAFSGVFAAKIAGAVFTITEGIVTGYIETDGRRTDIRVIGDTTDYSREKLEAFPLVVSARDSKLPVFLGSLGRIERRETEAALARRDRSDVAYLDLIPTPGQEKSARLFFKNLPYDLLRADQSVFEKYQSTVVITLALAVILLYLVMAAQFESFILPLIIMLSILFAMAGAGPMLLLTRTGLDSGSVLGLIVLFGIAINNGIVLFEAALERINKGYLPAGAVYSGALERFRPVLISSLTTVVGLVPLLFSSGASQRSMAAAMIGGLVVSTTLVIFVMPPVFAALFSRRRKSHD